MKTNIGWPAVGPRTPSSACRPSSPPPIVLWCPSTPHPCKSGFSRDAVGTAVALCLLAATTHAQPISVSDYPSIQAAVNANPGQVIVIPEGDHRISEPIFITSDYTVLRGPGTIVQADDDTRILAIEECSGVTIEGITLTRPDGARETTERGILAISCERLRIDSVRVIDNHSNRGAIELNSCRDVDVIGCEVLNYKRITTDDRTKSPEYGYAFRCIDGTGIWVDRCVGVRIVGNRIADDRLLPTQEFAEAEGLGEVTARNETLGRLASHTVARDGRVKNWHQGSAILVTAPRDTRDVTIERNTIHNAAQGIDIHADKVDIIGNVVDHAFMGVKVLHGSSDVRVTGNVLKAIDLWGILLGPGSASGEGNVQTRIEVSGNIIADMGTGHEYWNWWEDDPNAHSPSALRLNSPPLPENPPMTDVSVTGNIVTSRNPKAPGYRWAAWIGYPELPDTWRFSDNLFTPGASGISNVKLR